MDVRKLELTQKSSGGCNLCKLLAGSPESGANFGHSFKLICLHIWLLLACSDCIQSRWYLMFMVNYKNNFMNCCQNKCQNNLYYLFWSLLGLLTKQNKCISDNSTLDHISQVDTLIKETSRIRSYIYPIWCCSGDTQFLSTS